MTTPLSALAWLSLGLVGGCAAAPPSVETVPPVACVARVRLVFLEADFAVDLLQYAGGTNMGRLLDGSRRCFPNITSAPDPAAEGWCRRLPGEDRVLELGGSREVVTRMLELLGRLDVRDSP